MKLLALALALGLQPFAHASSISCVDTKTFAYGTAHGSDDATTGTTTISFSSSVLSVFAQHFIPNPAGYTQVTITFSSPECTGLSSCSGSDLLMDLQDDTGKTAQVLVDTAVVSFSANGLTAEVVKGVTIRADATVPLNKCTTSPTISSN